MKTLWITALVAALVVLVLFLPIWPAHSQVPSLTLEWTASGDDGNVGRALVYEIKWSTTRPDTTKADGSGYLAWWASATAVVDPPDPLDAGTKQSMVVAPPGGFTSGRAYYFLMRAIDDAGNFSWSNVAVKDVPDTVKPAPIIDLRAL